MRNPAMINISEMDQPLMEVSTPFFGWPFSEHLILAQNMGELADIRHSGIVVEGGSRCAYDPLRLFSKVSQGLL